MVLYPTQVCCLPLVKSMKTRTNYYPLTPTRFFSARAFCDARWRGGSLFHVMSAKLCIVRAFCYIITSSRPSILLLVWLIFLYFLLLPRPIEQIKKRRHLLLTADMKFSEDIALESWSHLARIEANSFQVYSKFFSLCFPGLLQFLRM
jgi:hypothetical protein